MRPLTAILLLLLPALLLPAGLLLRICACAELRTTRERANCCSTQEPAAAEPVASCCTRRAPRPEDAPTASSVDCRCRLVHVGDDQPSAPPGAPFVLMLPPATAVAMACTELPSNVVWHHAHATTRAPPPHDKRNLPLRL